MSALYEGLTGMGIATNRIFYESFGPATVLKRAAPAPGASRTVRGCAGASPLRPLRHRAANGRASAGHCWNLPESLGIAPQFSCRSGICGTCATPILGGAVDYLEEPVAPREAGEVLLCCSVPRPGAEVVLDI